MNSLLSPSVKELKDSKRSLHPYFGPKNADRRAWHESMGFRERAQEILARALLERGDHSAGSHACSCDI